MTASPQKIPSTPGHKAAVLELPLDQIIDLLHVTHAPERIEQYREALASGAEFPPISVIRFGGRWFVADGHKRYCAYKLLNRSHIPVEVWNKRRWLADHWRQFRHKTRQQFALIFRSIVDPEARPRVRRLFWDTVGHYKRIALSLAGRPEKSGLRVLAGGELKAEGARDGRLATEAEAQLGAAPLPNAVFRRLLGEALYFKGRVAAAVVTLGCLSGSQLYLTWIAKQWIDGPLITGDRALMMRLLLTALAVAALMMFGMFASRYLLNSLNQSLVKRLRDRAQKRLMAIELPAVRRFQSGELMSRVFNDAGALSEFVREILRRTLGESMTLIGAISMIFYLNWRLALVAGAMVPVVAVLLTRLGKTIRERSAHAQKEIGALTATFNEQLAGLSTIKNYQTEEAEHRRFADQSATYMMHVLRSEWWAAFLMTTVWMVTAGALLGVVWYGSSLIMSHQATHGTLLAFCAFAIQTVEPLRRMSEVQSMLQRALAAATRVYQLIDLGPVETGGPVTSSPGLRGELRFEDVRFRYRADKQVIEALDLRIFAGQTAAIVAGSGGGKSTIASLLIRFYDPNSGRILLDGVDLREFSLHELRRLVCIAEQEPFVFTGSLRDNIRYGSPEASESALIEAVELAGLAPFVATLPSGLSAPLAEGGKNLSGGQKQRIALARAIVRDPAVLVLDEATSALDSDTERQIFGQLQQWLANRTALVFAHRLSTVSRFPRVIVMDSGRVVGDGTASDLLSTCAAFGRLFADQLTPLGPAPTSGNS